MVTTLLQGRGTVITGRIEQGIVRTGDEIELVGIQSKPTKSVVTGTMMLTAVVQWCHVHSACKTVVKPDISASTGQHNRVERTRVLGRCRDVQEAAQRGTGW